MSEDRFTEGNLLVLYAVYYNNTTNHEIPEFIMSRVRLCVQTYKIIVASKPDKKNTTIIVCSKQEDYEKIKSFLVSEGIDPNIITLDSQSKSVGDCFSNILKIIKAKINPPYIYFIASVWLKDVYDSTVISKMKGFKVQFEGALDHRPVDEVERDKLKDSPKKGMEYYKKKTKDIAVDMLLNYIFPKDKK